MSLLDKIIRILFGKGDRRGETPLPEKMDELSEVKEVNLFENNFKKGYEFEKYVVELFNENYFKVNSWTTDISGKHDGKWVESNFNPDLIMRYIPRDEKFALVLCNINSAN